jgi:hypothetical protein
MWISAIFTVGCVVVSQPLHTPRPSSHMSVRAHYLWITCPAYFALRNNMPVPVAARSKAWFCGPSLAGITGSNPTGGMDVCLLLWVFVLSGRDICVGLVPRLEESYRVWCVSECDREPWITRSPWRTGGCCASGEKEYNVYVFVLHLMMVSASLCSDCVTSNNSMRKGSWRNWP